jgi:hypothetical protein
MPPIMNEEKVYRDALNGMLTELTDLMADREEMDAKMEATDRRIGRLRRGAIGLALVCGMGPGEIAKSRPELFPDQIDPDTGLTDAVREVLKSDNYYFSPVEIRDSLKAKNYDIGKYKNPLASIHTILKRLTYQKQVVEGTREGRTTYRWANVKEIDEDMPL